MRVLPGFVGGQGMRGVGEGGADVNRRDGAGRTGLWYVREGDEGLRRGLRELGARL